MIKISKLQMTVALAVVTCSVGGKLQGQVNWSDQLLLNGTASYHAGAYYDAALWLFAYLQSNSPRLQSDPDFTRQVYTAYAYCDGEMKSTIAQKDQLQAQLNVAQQQIASYQQQLTRSNRSQAGQASTSSGISVPPPQRAPPPPLVVPPDLRQAVQQQRTKIVKHP